MDNHVIACICVNLSLCEDKTEFKTMNFTNAELKFGVVEAET